MMDRAEALLFVARVRALSVKDSTFCKELAQQLSPAEESTLRSHLREAGGSFATDFALVPRGRAKGAS
jgi:hypothetical protein